MAFSDSVVDAAFGELVAGASAPVLGMAISAVAPSS